MGLSRAEKLRLGQEEVPTPGRHRCGTMLKGQCPTGTLGHWFLQPEIRGSRGYIQSLSVLAGYGARNRAAPRTSADLEEYLMSRCPSPGCRDFPIFQRPPSSTSGEERLPVNERRNGWRQGRYFQMTGRLTNVDNRKVSSCCSTCDEGSSPWRSTCQPFPFRPVSVGGRHGAQPHQAHRLHRRRAQRLREQSYSRDNGCVRPK